MPSKGMAIARLQRRRDYVYAQYVACWPEVFKESPTVPTLCKCGGVHIYHCNGGTEDAFLYSK